MGNPSDGFEGKTVSFLMKNFFAEVSLERRPEGSAIELVPNNKLDPTQYCSLVGFYEYTDINGYYGGLRLLQATTRTFAACLRRKGLLNADTRGFRMSYDTNIPRCVGLSGSSAIIIAAFRCLLRHYEVSLDALGISEDVFPSLILSIEKTELGISAGLQDRVVQTYGGLMHMDFTRSPIASNSPSAGILDASNLLPIGRAPSDSMEPGGVYTPLDPLLLYRLGLYMAYNTSVGGESGGVHNTVKEKWARREPQLVRSLRTIYALVNSRGLYLYLYP